MLDYEYIKSHYRLIAVDLSREKELDSDQKAIEQIEFIGQLKKLDNNLMLQIHQSMINLCLINLCLLKNQRNEVKIFKFPQGSVTVIKDGKLLRSKSAINKYTSK